MKKNYTFPVLEEVKIEIEDVIAASGILGENLPGDTEGTFFTEDSSIDKKGFFNDLFN